jgi:hypothetical protein
MITIWQIKIANGFTIHEFKTKGSQRLAVLAMIVTQRPDRGIAGTVWRGEPPPSMR